MNMKEVVGDHLFSKFLFFVYLRGWFSKATQDKKMENSIKKKYAYFSPKKEAGAETGKEARAGAGAGPRAGAGGGAGAGAGAGAGFDEGGS